MVFTFMIAGFLNWFRNFFFWWNNLIKQPYFIRRPNKWGLPCWMDSSSKVNFFRAKMWRPLLSACIWDHGYTILSNLWELFVKCIREKKLRFLYTNLQGSKSKHDPLFPLWRSKTSLSYLKLNATATVC